MLALRPAFHRGSYLTEQKLADFLLQQCQQRSLSLRRLSLNSGLSAGTVHNIIKRQYHPTLFSLNRLADYFGVKREYLWQLAGILEDMDYDPETMFGDPRMRFILARVDKLPQSARDLIIGNITAIIAYIEKVLE